MTPLQLCCIVALLGACAEEDNRVCTLLGCGYVAWLPVAQLQDVSEVADTTITVCINERCASGALPVPAPTNDLKEVVLAGPFVARASVATTDPAFVTVDAIVVEAEGLAHGDVYAATITRNDGSIVATRSWHATYRESDPNGPRCEPHCWSAMLIGD